jgi:hypothetical protein
LGADLETRYPDGIPNGVMSDHIWREFRKAEEKWCCRVVKDSLTGQNGVLLTGRISLFSGGRIISLKVEHCPGCGRKL